jgi:hypothetical protein
LLPPPLLWLARLHVAVLLPTGWRLLLRQHLPTPARLLFFDS